MLSLHFRPKWTLEKPRQKSCKSDTSPIVSPGFAALFVAAKKTRYNENTASIMERFGDNYSASLHQFVFLQRKKLDDPFIPVDRIIEDKIAAPLQVSLSAIKEWPEGNSGKKMGVGDLIVYTAITGDLTLIDNLYYDMHRILEGEVRFAFTIES